jgi:hypothetical protein
MQGVETCAECGVPIYITSEHLWHSSGFILQRRDPRHIIIFLESENLEELLKGVERILGIPIERIVVDARRRTAAAYMERVIPEGLKRAVREKKVEVKPVIEGMTSIGHVLGYGRFEVVDCRYQGDEEDFLLVRVENPYSVMLGSADPVAAFEALVGEEMGMDHEQVGPSTFLVRGFRSPHPEEFRERLRMRRYEYGEGDFSYEKCPSCGGPAFLSLYRWDLERGIITHRESGRRMVFFAPSVLEAVFGELERELGEEIPKVVVEAQKRFTAGGFYRLKGEEPAADLKFQLALRGIGLLSEFEESEEGLRLFMPNAAVPLMVVGLAQGLFESRHETGSRAEWKTGERGELEVRVIPA